MGYILYVIIFLMSLFTLNRFHKKQTDRRNKVSAIFIGNTLIQLPEEDNQLKLLVHPDKAGRQHEFLEILNELVKDKSVFPEERIYHAVHEWMRDTHNISLSDIKSTEIIPFNKRRGWGGKVINTGFGEYGYIIGYYRTLTSYLKSHTDLELLRYIEDKAKRKNSTNIVICSIELDENENKILHHGINKKIDFIGCIFIDS